MIYLADHPSTALLETIVHFERDALPHSFQLLAIDAVKSLPFETAVLPDKWFEESAQTQKIGQDFLKRRIHALLRVPSVIMPQAFNYLLNPAHPDAGQFKIAQTWRYPFDSRFLM